jgi:hypothetical protein
MVVSLLIRAASRTLRSSPLVAWRKAAGCHPKRCIYARRKPSAWLAWTSHRSAQSWVACCEPVAAANSSGRNFSQPKHQPRSTGLNSTARSAHRRGSVSRANSRHPAALSREIPFFPSKRSTYSQRLAWPETAGDPPHSERFPPGDIPGSAHGRPPQLIHGATVEASPGMSQLTFAAVNQLK